MSCDLNSILENLRSQYESSMSQFHKKGDRSNNKIIEIYYKVPYYDAIKEYSDNWKNSVYKTDYKDIDKIQQKDPVFEIIFQDWLITSRGKTKCLGKDPYSTRDSTEQLEVKKSVIKEFKIPANINPEFDVNADLSFDGNFECGNLHSAIKITDIEYHLFIHPDTNTGGHTQWFYFKVNKMKQDKIYTFKIMNFNK